MLNINLYANIFHIDMSRSHSSHRKANISHVEKLLSFVYESIGLITFYTDLPPQKEGHNY